MTLAVRMIFVALFAVVVIAAIQWRAGARERAAEAAYPAVGQIIDVDGVPVHAWVRGTGPDLVLIHGASGNLRDFTFDLTDQLSQRYRVIAFDRPGLGWTGRLPGRSGAWNTDTETPYEQAALLQRAADQLDVKNPIVLGHSFGGAVTLAWGLSRPDETAALVLVGAASQPWEGDLGLLYQVTSSALGGALVIPPAVAFLPESYVRNSIETIFAPQPAPEGYAAHIGPALTLRRETTRANAQQVNTLYPHIVEMSRYYKTLPMPIELVHGDADTIVPASVHAEVFVRDMPDATLTMLPGVGHMPHHTHPEVVVDAIDRAAARAGLR